MVPCWPRRSWRIPWPRWPCPPRPSACRASPRATTRPSPAQRRPARLETATGSAWKNGDGVRRGRRARPCPNEPGSGSPDSGDLGGFLAEDQAVALGRHHDGVAGAELAGEDLLRQRVLQLLLDGALERPGAVDRVEADIAKQGQGAVLDAQADLPLGQALAQVGGLDAGDGLDLLAAQRVEDHDLVETVDELGTEVRLHHAHHRRLHLHVAGLALAGQLLDVLA